MLGHGEPGQRVSREGPASPRYVFGKTSGGGVERSRLEVGGQGGVGGSSKRYLSAERLEIWGITSEILRKQTGQALGLVRCAMRQESKWALGSQIR